MELQDNGNVYQNFGFEQEANLYANTRDLKQPPIKPKPKDKHYLQQETQLSGKGRTSHKYVVGIDLGFACSGYAFAKTSNLENITLNKNWASSKGFTAMKMPTAVFAGDNQSDQIGYDAIEDFETYFSENDRMGLIKNFTKNITIKEKGADRRAKNGMSTGLKCLSDHAISAIKHKYGGSVNPTDILWVTPLNQDRYQMAKKQLIAITKEWKDKEFIKETDASFICCVSTVPTTDKPKKVLVINAGGSDIQLACYKKDVKQPNLYKVTHRKSVGFGSHFINRLFYTLIEEIFGKEFIPEYKRKWPADWLDMASQFEACKKGASPSSASSVIMTLRTTFGEMVKSTHKTNIQDFLRSSKKLSITRDYKLELNGRILASFYETLMSNVETKITKSMKDIFQSEPEKVYLVGGFADNAYLQDTVRRLFYDTPPVIPVQPDMCALRGCILFKDNKVEIHE